MFYSEKRLIVVFHTRAVPGKQVRTETTNRKIT